MEKPNLKRTMHEHSRIEYGSYRTDLKFSRATDSYCSMGTGLVWFMVSVFGTIFKWNCCIVPTEKRKVEKLRVNEHQLHVNRKREKSKCGARLRQTIARTEQCHSWLFSNSIFVFVAAWNKHFWWISFWKWQAYSRRWIKLAVISFFELNKM